MNEINTDESRNATIGQLPMDERRALHNCARASAHTEEIHGRLKCFLAVVGATSRSDKVFSQLTPSTLQLVPSRL